MLSGHPHAASSRHAIAQALRLGAISFDAVKMPLLMRSDKMVAFREAIELSIAVLIPGIVVGFIAYAGAHDQFAIKLSSLSQTCPLSLEPDYAGVFQEHPGITKDAARKDRDLWVECNDINFDVYTFNTGDHWPGAATASAAGPN